MISEQRSILVVDDEPGIRNVMARFFSRRGYACRTAENGHLALSLLRESPSQAVLSDIAMEGMSGLEVTRHVMQSNPDTAVVLMTGKADMAMAIEALRLGVSDFLLKPFNLQTAEHSVERAVLKKQAFRHAEQERIRLKSFWQNPQQSEDDVAIAVVKAFHKMHNFRDLETSGHAERVSHYAVQLARKMGISPEEQKHIRHGALLHDIGKVVVPDRILLKTAPLTEKEMAIIRKHAEVGYSILAEVPMLKPSAQMVLEHHERHDGKGYPRGLRGNQICLGARIFAIADAYDAITTDRPYRKAQSDAAAREELSRHSGTQFDPPVVEAFLNIPVQEWLKVEYVFENSYGRGFCVAEAIN